MTSSTFESLRVWHDARRLTTRIYSIARKGRFGQDFALRDQICRAAISVMSNIAEGYERGGAKEFVQFLRIAKGSAAEIRAQLYIAQDIGYLDEQIAHELRKHAISISRQISALANAIRDGHFVASMPCGG
jgi:four helix bundle protein